MSDQRTEDLVAGAIQALVRDLRQPLSSMEAIAYYLEMTLPAEQLQARRHMRELQELVGQTNSILAQASKRLV